MKCEDFQNRISGYLDGELTPQDTHLFKKHMVSCSSCKAYAESLKNIDNLLQEMPPPLPDESYWSSFDVRLKEKLDASASKRPWWNFYAFFKRPMSWAAAAVLILLAVFMPAIRDSFFTEEHLPARYRTERSIREDAGEEKEMILDFAPPVSMEESVSIAEETPLKMQREKNEIQPDADFDVMRESEAPLSDDMASPPASAGRIEGDSLIRDDRGDLFAVDDRPAYSPPAVSGAPAVPSIGGEDYPKGRRDTIPFQPSAPAAPGEASPSAAGPAPSRPPLRHVSPRVASAEPADKETPAADGPLPSAPVLPEERPSAEAGRTRSSPISLDAAAVEEKEDISLPPSFPSGIGRTAAGAPPPAPSVMPEAEGSPSDLLSSDRSVRESAKPSMRTDRTAPSSAEINRYLSVSEAVLIKLISLPQNISDLEDLRSELNLSNYLDHLNQNRRQFSKIPSLYNHASQMKHLTESLMTVKPDEISVLQSKVIKSGIIEETRDMKHR